MRILDSHIHLFDTARPEGVPYPSRENAVLWKPALPGRYRALAVPLGIVGAIAVEASPWFGDNDWLLRVCKTDPMILGMVGNLEPERADFHKHLDRLARDPLFLGIRYGNLWGRSLARAVETPAFVDGIKHLQRAGLTLDTANPDAELLRAVVRLSDLVPGLRIVIDHLPRVVLELGDLQEIGRRPTIFAKISEVSARDSSDAIGRMFEVFSEDRLLFGSDWPNWDTEGSLADTVGLVRGLPEKVLYRNAIAVYQRGVASGAAASAPKPA